MFENQRNQCYKPWSEFKKLGNLELTCARVGERQVVKWRANSPSLLSVQALSRLGDCSHTWTCGLLYSLCRFRSCSLANLLFPLLLFFMVSVFCSLTNQLGVFLHSLSFVLILKQLSICCTVQTPGVGEIERNLNYKAVRFHRKSCAKKDILVMLAIQNEESWVRISSSNPGNKENSFSKLWGWESEFRGRTLLSSSLVKVLDRHKAVILETNSVVPLYFEAATFQEFSSLGKVLDKEDMADSLSTGTASRT